MTYTTTYHSPLSIITLASDGEYLTGLWFNDQKYFGSTLTHNSIDKELPIFIQTKAWLDIYFNGEIPTFLPPLRYNTTVFRKMVWNILLTIPYGTVITYKDIAQEIAKQTGQKSMSAQAIGGAVGHNPISLIIPCHRVVGTSGSLTGYAGGLNRKNELLQREKVNMTNLFVPSKKNL
ncbi:MAG: methylated-DNA--[protein]-cysteine S-methyltransferase [Anaerorhabdus sp.]|uniref:methylated-DNA--[protein]-cysteine S-methyltransferase n=1 Tax=Anaerorhabdus sp. TaxID=1872524 RepID=UPI003A83599C